MPLIVESIEYIGETDDYVYDLETDDGTFASSSDPGPNDILCKNTDSCYVTFNVQKSAFTNEEGLFDEVAFMKENFRLSKECAEKISAIFKSPIKLEFEKVMFPFFLYQKKRYAYKEWVSYMKPNEVEYKGLSLIRRDYCPYVKEVCDRIFKILMNDKSIEITIINDARKSFVKIKHTFTNDLDMTEVYTTTIECTDDIKNDSFKEIAQLYARQCIRALILDNTVGIKDLTISKSLKNTYKLKGIDVKWTLGLCVDHMKQKKKGSPCTSCSLCMKSDHGIKKFFKPKGEFVPKECEKCQKEYVVITNPHVRIANRLRELDPINGPKPPDRVSFVYVLVDNWARKKQHEFTKHPSELGPGDKINYLYYFSHQLQNSIDQIFEIIMDNPKTIYSDLVYECINKNNNQGTLSFADLVKEHQYESDDDDYELVEQAPEKLEKPSEINKDNIINIL